MPRTPSAEIEIAAPLPWVFDVLLDGTRYPEWNPLILEETGDSRRVGAPVAMKVRLGRFTVRPTRATTRLVEPQADGSGHAEWVHRFASWPARLGLVRSERHHELEALAGGRTHYVTYEHFWGPLARFMPLGEIDAGFKAQARALRDFCERE